MRFPKVPGYSGLLIILIATLAGVALWVGHSTAKQWVGGSIPSQGTCLGCGPGPHQDVYERQTINVSLSY